MLILHIFLSLSVRMFLHFVFANVLVYHLAVILWWAGVYSCDNCVFFFLQFRHVASDIKQDSKVVEIL